MERERELIGSLLSNRVAMVVMKKSESSTVNKRAKLEIATEDALAKKRKEENELKEIKHL